MPFNSMKFRHSWRPYQQRVLYALQQHLTDRRLHLVAAPGAGKTMLGLEVFRMLQKPALILSPTRIIRDQWIDRLKDFCETDHPRQLPWVSRSVHDPAVLTSITYQALHARFAEALGDEEPDGPETGKGPAKEDIHRFIQTLEQHRIEVLILDEAHHLRAEWWRALEKICAHFPDITLVALTATPPYDSGEQAWARYEQLCGPVDEEISVPELVKSGTLCPHQDFIRACDATVTEQKQIEMYDQRVMTTCQTLFQSEAFEQVIRSHAWLSQTSIESQTDIESEVIKAPEVAIAMLCFLKAKRCPGGGHLMQILDLTVGDIPEPGRHWWQVLIESVLFSDGFGRQGEHQPFIEQLRKQLQASELLHKRELSLERSARMERSLSLSASKVRACSDIHHLEYQHRGSGLRQAILTDYIRDEALISGMDTGEVNLGAWPVFETLALSSPVPEKLALLTGRLTILPVELFPSLQALLSPDQLNTEPLFPDSADQNSLYLNSLYIKVTAPLNQLTSAMTALLMAGDINVLVGTRSLLGEGWDAPALNSLILASSVGSFMLTNQMRGRAIRIDPQHPRKVSSIWHLVALNTRSDSGFSDLFSLSRRFDTFVGLSEKQVSIESGFNRMDANYLIAPLLAGKKPSVAENNRQMAQRFQQLDQIATRWHRALTIDSTGNRVTPSVKTARKPEIRGYILRHSLAYLSSQLAGAVLVALSYVFSFPAVWKSILLFISLAVGGALLYKLPKTVKTIRVLCRYLPVDGALIQIGNALKDSLCQAGWINTPVMQLKVRTAEMPDGQFYLCLTGGTFYDASLFADCLAEILAPVESPRYLIVRSGQFMGLERDDYHAVPLKFATKKETAEIFCRNWNKHVCPSGLIYTRSAEGRKALLKARGKAFSSLFREEVKKQDRWI